VLLPLIIIIIIIIIIMLNSFVWLA